jgi:hypothetical protein
MDEGWLSVPLSGTVQYPKICLRFVKESVHFTRYTRIFSFLQMMSAAHQLTHFYNTWPKFLQSLGLHAIANNTGKKNAVFWDVAPCRSCVRRCFGGTYRLHLQGRNIRELCLQPSAHAGSSLGYFSTLKMETIRSSETSVHTRSTRRYIPEDGILHSHRCENLKSYTIQASFTVPKQVFVFEKNWSSVKLPYATHRAFHCF